MAQPVYESPNPINFQSLAPGLKTFNTSMQGMMKGVSDLAEQQDRQNLETNTRNMIAHRAQQRKAGGLGTEDMNIAGISSHFNNQIDMEKVQAADAAGLQKQLSGAMDTARTEALTAFDGGMDMSEAGEVLRKSLLEQSATSGQAQKAVTDFRTNNAFRTADRKASQEKAFNVGKNTLIQNLTKDANLSNDNAIQALLVGVPEHLRETYATDYKDFLTKRASLDPEDQANFDHQVKLQTIESAAFERTGKQKLAQAKGSIGEDPLSDITVGKVDKYIGQLDGELQNDISQRLAKGWDQGMFNTAADWLRLEFGNTHGDAAAKAFEDEMNTMSKDAAKYGLSTREMLSIGIQAFNRSSRGPTGGAVLNKSEFDANKEALLSQVQNNKAKTTAYNEAQLQFTNEQAAMAKRHANEAKNYKSALGRQNIRGGEIDTNTIFKQALNQGGSGTAQGGAEGDTAGAGTQTPVRTPQEYLDEASVVPELRPQNTKRTLSEAERTDPIAQALARSNEQKLINANKQTPIKKVTSHLGKQFAAEINRVGPTKALLDFSRKKAVSPENLAKNNISYTQNKDKLLNQMVQQMRNAGSGEKAVEIAKKMSRTTPDMWNDYALIIEKFYPEFSD